MIEGTRYWPLWTSRLLSLQEQNKLKKLTPNLRRAQFYLWRALNIYDDFFDGEGKKPELPEANTYFRKFLEIHYRLNLSDNYYKFMDKLFNSLDKTNQDEILMPKLKFKNGLISIPTKFPVIKSVSSLCDKSLVLALSPLALMSFLGYKINDKKSQAILNFFKYALSAKQLSDDSHDWLEDLNNGLTTQANIPILKAIKKKHLKIEPKKSPAILNLLFAQESAPLIIIELENLCYKARKEMKKFSDKNNNILITQLIVPLENACRRAKQFQSQISDL